MLHQYHGNDMARLRDAAAALLAHEPPSPLVPELVIVPNLGMARWLRQGLATRLGIAANLRLEMPRGFIDSLARATLDAAGAGVDRAYAKDALTLRLMRLLPTLLDAPACAPLRDYLSAGREPRRLLALCRRLAALFDQYLLYRPEWLLAWEDGRPETGVAHAREAWQPLLWRALVADIRAAHPAAQHGAARLVALGARLADVADTGGIPAGRLLGFGLGALPPMLLQLLVALSARIDVHLFQFNPCREYWGGIVSERTRARWQRIAPEKADLAEVGNPLLAAWGTLGRDNLEALLEASDGDIEPCFEEPAADTVLAAIQRDMLDLVTPREPRQRAADDESIRFSHAHSALREVEALHDQLLHLFERLPGLRPRDIVVMAPDIAVYSSAITAVFEAARGHAPDRFVPWSIADRAETEENGLARSFLHLLELSASRFRASEIRALLAVPAIAARLGLDADAVAELGEWIEASGIRWGLGTADAATPRLARNTWRFGLERMLLGLALEEGVVYRGATPIVLGGAEAHERIGRLAAFIDTLSRHAESLTRARPMDEWLRTLAALIAEVYSDAAEHAAELAALKDAVNAIADGFDAAAHAQPIEREVLADLLAESLATREGSHAFLRGGVNFCQLAPLRCIPFRVVCLLGMNADTFPRTREPPGFDLMALAPRRGDPSRRADDRYLFLEALVAARDQLWISHVARDERSNEAREPAVLVTELRDYIDRHWRAEGDGPPSSALTHDHRLKPFDPAYFGADPDARLFSYRAEWLPVARRPDAAPAFADRTLPPPALEDITTGALQAFFRNPSRAFLEQRFGVRLPNTGAMAGDSEPFALDALDTHAIKRAFVTAALAREPDERVVARLAGAGVLPHGHAGTQLLRRGAASVSELTRRVSAWADLAPRAIAVDLRVDGLRLHGTLDGLRGDALRLFHPAATLRGNTLVRFLIAHLLACAADAVAADSELAGESRLITLPRVTSADARARLHDVLQVYREGLCRPLPLFPKSSHAYAAAIHGDKPVPDALAAARKEFLSSQYSDGESHDVCVRRVFPDPAQALDDDFERCALRVFRPLLDMLRRDAS